MNTHVKIKWSLGFFILGLVLSGLSAIPIVSEIDFLYRNRQWLPHACLEWVYTLHKTDFPSFLCYGNDWLAFAHFLFAILFIGPFLYPLTQKWIVYFGMIACAAILPYALIFGYVRDIPFFHRLIDCSFGLIGFIPLYLSHRWIKELELNTVSHGYGKEYHLDFGEFPHQ